KCSGATVGAKVPGLLDDAEPKAAIESGERIGQAFEREAAGNISSRARAQSGTVNRWRPDTITTWLDELLSAGRGERHLRGTRRLDPAQAARSDLAAMGAHYHSCQRFDATRSG